jgi:hypothetical protein
VVYTWDGASATVPLDLNAEPEAFFMALERRFRALFKRTLERENHFVRFALERETNETGQTGHGLPLDKEDFPEEWKCAVEWIRNNRTMMQESHLYAVIEFDGG